MSKFLEPCPSFLPDLSTQFNFKKNNDILTLLIKLRPLSKFSPLNKSNVTIKLYQEKIHNFFSLPSIRS